LNGFFIVNGKIAFNKTLLQKLPTSLYYR